MDNNQLEPGRRRPPVGFRPPAPPPAQKLYALPPHELSRRENPPDAAGMVPAAVANFEDDYILLPNGPVDLNTFIAMADAVRVDRARYHGQRGWATP